MAVFKRLLALLAIALLCASICLTSCNRDISFGSFAFHYVHVQMYNTIEPKHFEIEKWRDDDGGIELFTKDHGTILLGDGTYMMYDVGECPLCGQVEYE